MSHTAPPLVTLNSLRHRMTAPALATFTLFGLGLIGLSLLSGQPARASDKPANAASAPAKPALTVSTTQPQAVTWGVQLAANGNIAAWQEAVIGAQTNGLQLREVYANVGDTVKKGQVLARFANETVQAELAQARAALAEAEAAAKDAAANAERARSLKNTDALSAQQLAQYATGEQTALARQAAARAQLAAAQERANHAQVTAPDHGVILARSATVGAVPPPGTELFRLLRQSRLEWRAEVMATELARIKPGTPATLTTAAGAEVKGRVRQVAPLVDAQTRNAIVYVDIPPLAAGQTSVLPGMFAKGRFEVGAQSGLAVPTPAVVVRDGFAYVFKLKPDQRVQLARVKTGRTQGNLIEVTEGLKTGETVVASGAGFLGDGDLVRVAK